MRPCEIELDLEEPENTNTIPIPLSGNTGMIPWRRTNNITTFWHISLEVENDCSFY